MVEIAADKPARFFHLVRYYAIASAGVITCVTLFLAWAYYKHSEKEMILSQEMVNTSLSKVFANTDWPRFAYVIARAKFIDAQILKDDPSIIGIDEALKTIAFDLPILKMRIYDLDGLTAYSTDPREIGVHKKATSERFNTARRGKVSSVLMFKKSRKTPGDNAPLTSPHSFFEKIKYFPDHRQIVESYIPIGRALGRPEAVLETHTDVSALARTIILNAVFVFLGLFLTFGSLYGILFFIVRRAYAITCEQYASFEAIFNNAPYALIMINTEHKVVLCNSAFTFMFGYSAEEFIGKSMVNLYENPEEFEKWNRLRHLLDDEHSHNSYRGRYKRKTGEIFPGETAMAPIGNPDDQVFGFIGIIHDISDRVHREEETRRYQNVISHSRRLSLLGEMAAGLAHEINQPLAAIANYTEGCIHRLKTGNADSDKLLGALQSVSNQAERAGEIINRIRGFVKQKDVHKSPTHVRNLIDEAIALIESDLERRKIVLTTDFEDNDHIAIADRIQIQQVILNLIRNAGDAMEEHHSPTRVVHIQTAASGGKKIEIAITDSGPGIENENLRHIFSPFFTTKESGLGLGLNICQSIVENHGGSMWATSVPGQGATIHFTLPAAIKETREENQHAA